MRPVLSSSDLSIVLQAPERLEAPNAWIGHIPFAFWIVNVLTPRTFVELGVHSGNSLCAFCQEVKRSHLPTSCFGVDRWAGHDQAGRDGLEIYEDLSAFLKPKYGSFARLVRSSFDEAVDYFADGSIDLLHLDGSHTMEAVQADFITWRPKLAPNAVVLVHNTNVRERKFGVWRFWEDVSKGRPSFNFLHSHGLGVLALGDVPERLQPLLNANEHETAAARDLFNKLGSRLVASDGAAAAGAPATRLPGGVQARDIASTQRGASTALVSGIEDHDRQRFAVSPGSVDEQGRHTEQSEEPRAVWDLPVFEAIPRAHAPASTDGALDAKQKEQSSNKRIAVHQEQLAAVRAELSAATVTRDRMESERRNPSTAASSSMVDVLNRRLRGLLASESELEQQLASARKATSSEAEKRRAEEERVQVLESQLATVQTELQTADAARDRSNDASRTQFAQASSLIDELNDQIRSAQALEADSSQRLTALQRELTEERAELEAAKARIGLLVHDCAAAWTKYGEALADARTAEARAAAAEKATVQPAVPPADLAFYEQFKKSPGRATLLLADSALLDTGFIDGGRTPNLPGVNTVRLGVGADGRTSLVALDRQVRCATGRIVVVASVGDQLGSGWLESFEGVFETHPLTLACEGIVVGADGRVAWSSAVVDAQGRLERQGGGRILDDCQVKSAEVLQLLVPGLIAIERDLFVEIGGFDLSLGSLDEGLVELGIRAKGAGYVYRRAPSAHCRIVFQESTIAAATPDSQLLSRAGRLLQPRPRALFIDATVVKPDRDAGSMDTFWTMQIFLSLGYDITFIGMYELAASGRYVDDLRRLGIRCPVALDIPSCQWYIEHQARFYDVMVMYRVVTAAFLVDLARYNAPKVKIIFHTVDLHFLREQRHAKMTDDQHALIQAENTKKEELRCLVNADASIVVSEMEFHYIKEEEPSTNLYLMPIMHPGPGRLGPLESRSGVMFVGGFGHAPNIDAVRFLCESIWPHVRRTLPSERITIVGANVTDEVRAFHNPELGIHVAGFVADLAPLYASARVNVAPLRFGAGIKGKVLAAMMVGLPTVATDIAAEGMGLSGGENVLISNDGEEFATAIVRLCTEDPLWQRISDKGLAFSQDRFTVDAQIPKVRRILADLDLPN